MTLVLGAAAWITGIFLADRFDTSAPALALFLVAWLLLPAVLTPLRRFTRPAILVALVLLAMLRVELFAGERVSELAAYHGSGTVQLQGVVARDPEAAGTAIRLRLRVDRVKSGDVWTDASGALLVTLRETTEIVQRRDRPYFRYGDRLLLVGAVQATPTLEEFDYPAYLARQGVFSVMNFPDATLMSDGGGSVFYRWLYGVRRRMADSLAEVVTEPQASLGQALLLGIRDGLPEDMVDDFRETGTSHVLAISGLHLSILLGIGLAVGQWVLGRRRQAYLALPLVLIWLYALISGMSPSVTRAAIMGSVYLAAVLLGRPRSTLPALGLAAAVMVAVNPDVLWSVSFQLSFAAMAGIAFLVEPVNRVLGTIYRRVRMPDEPRPPILVLVTDTVAMTIAATVATLPLVAFHFGRVSLVGIPTNALLLPALPFVLVTQAAAGLLEPVANVVAQPFGWLAWLTSAYVTGVVGLVARLPGASVETGHLGSAVLWTAYGLFIVVLLRFRPGRIVRPLGGAMPGDPLSLSSGHGGVPWWATAVVAALAALLWTAALSGSDSRLRVTFVGVGQGDAIFIVTPGGRQILVDGGPDPLGMVQYLGR
jgi:competence protein ComEC